MTIKVSHFFSWQRFNDDLLPFLLAQFKAGGAKHVVLGANWCNRIMSEPNFKTKLSSHVNESGLNFAGAHAPFGARLDLNTPVAADRDTAAQSHIELMNFAASQGIKTYTIHVGELQPGYTLQQMRDFASLMLERLLYAAEAIDITVAVENAEHSGGALSELMFYRERFRSSALGFCYDSGHANINGGEAVLTELLDDVVTSHIHDNDGKTDSHLPPGDGTINWEYVRKKLFEAPRLQSIQNEVNFLAHNASIHSLCVFFNEFAICDKLLK